MVLNIAGNETLDKLLQDAVGLNGKFLAIPGSAQECMKRISNYIIANTWSEETSMKKTNRGTGYHQQDEQSLPVLDTSFL